MRGSVWSVRPCAPLALLIAAALAYAATSTPSPAWAGDAKHAAGSPTGATVRKTQPVYVGTIVAPASLPGLGHEISRALVLVLRDAGLDARPLPAGGAHPESEAVLAGHVDDLGTGRVRLTITWQGHSEQAPGDLEHLDDLVYAVFELLRPRMVADGTLSAAPAPGPSPPTTVTSARRPDGKTADAPPGVDVKKPTPAAVTPAVATAPADGQPKDKDADAKKRPAPKTVKLAAAATHPVTTAPAVATAPAVSPPASLPPKDAVPSLPPPSTVVTAPTSPAPAALPAPPPVTNPTPPVQPAPVPFVRPRVAVNIVGEPLSNLPPTFYGAGVIAQQATLGYLQNRLRVTPVATRLTGLVGGLDALTQSLRLGARHTLMARFDTLADGFGAYGARTVSGRLHIVLLLDGRPLLDRSLAIPPSPYYPNETSAQVIGRIMTAALDAIGGELSARLNAPLPHAQ